MTRKDTLERELLELRQQITREEEARFSPHACQDGQALRRKPDPRTEAGHRGNFAVDADRILHSLAYTRYIDKTQVFSLLPNDHITHRVLHVQLVSKIGRTMGRLLRLNQDLIEAIALGHDIGHPPFGHNGETWLSGKCREHGLPPFMHNLQSVRFLDRLEKKGQGLNLSLQVLDGVLCHDGEVRTSRLHPKKSKTFEDLEIDIRNKEQNPTHNLVPMTLEGCLVRITDTVAYVGRDLEDAITLGLLDRAEVPDPVRSELGDSNGTIVYRLVADLVANSHGRDHLDFSPRISDALAELKSFNFERIYSNPKIKTQHAKLEAIYGHLFESFLADVRAGREESQIWREFLAGKEGVYDLAASPAEPVRDFLAGMTDAFFLRTYQRLVMPDILPGKFSGLPGKYSPERF